MPISRSTSIPRFLDYVTNYALVDPTTNALPIALQNLFLTAALRVPTFQRGISWETEQVKEFLESDSSLLGHVIISAVQQQTYKELVDGLQRFATGTALLNILYPLVLMPQAQYPNHQTSFVPLATYANNFQPVFSNNHQQLMSHRRRAIQDQYREFFKGLDSYVSKIISSGTTTEVDALANSILRSFLSRQVAIDDFSGFQSTSEVIKTFIGINTIRVELGTVDLVRTSIIEQAERFPAVWSAVQIEAAENNITDAFVDDGVLRKDVLPVATVAKELLEGGDAHRLFPTWAGGTSPQEVDEFLNFIDKAIAGVPGNSYVAEIVASGALPFSIMTLHYYSRLLQGHGLPAYFSSGAGQDQELHLYLRATYRAVLAGTVGQLGPIARDAAIGLYNALSDVAIDINATTGAGPLTQAPTGGWIRVQLASVNKEKAKRVFNACLLPPSNTPGAVFAPLNFGRSTNAWHIDHLIPARSLNPGAPGYTEGDRIVNFAPLVSQLNRVASNTPCSQKLAIGNMYANLVANNPNCHPYIQWLAQVSPPLAAALDNQAFLQPNAQPNVGDQRLNHLESVLSSRL